MAVGGKFRGKYAGIAWFTKSGKYYEYKVYPNSKWVYKGELRILRFKIMCIPGGASPYSYYYP